ncbi:MAG: TonB family protein [Gemmatimonadetes bacterium]|nr:energy transducer TonB [Gemmatimonadota bacterium]NIR78112.1 energy transducer TonB [Gemmatimonadota bacterium]NIT86679.1 energy transducer TonB [Gemmatimonadota bacterium]NIU30532.1 energy transducer TonB [Gemmatimonadota bacterium]NIU35371.1 TonB family protein [Gemmatimonadota bacterium]
MNAPSGGYAFPEILDRGRTQVLIERFYPDSLQALGVGGRVGLLAWISTEGGVRDVRVTLPSGLSALDEAAVLAARELHFRPARRDGVARPAWVEFAIEFRPPPPPAEDTVVLR